MNSNSKFPAHYASYIEDILARPSGQHAPDPVRLQQWIAAQHTLERQEVARALASEIQYIPHHQVMELCANLVDQLYAALDLSKPIVWWVGKPDKSGYMISLLCYHALKQKGYPEPTGFIESPTSFDEDKQYVYLDDMSYSGSQATELMTKIIQAYARKNQPFPHIFFGFMAITEYANNSMQNLTVIPYNHLKDYEKNVRNGKRSPIEGLLPEKYGSNRVFQYKIQNPFPRFFGKIIPSLKAKIGEENWMRALLYFDGRYKQVDSIVYFDHKVADSASTFMKVLLYGIVPSYNYSPYDNHISNNLKPTEDLHVYNETIVDDSDNKNILSFVPFIKGCEPDPKALRIWSTIFLEDTIYKEDAYDKNNRDNTKIKRRGDVSLLDFYRDYEEFISIKKEDEEYAKSRGKIDESVLALKQRLGKEEDTRDIDEILKETVPDWDDVQNRCPFSWYKGYFKGGRRRRTRQSKARVRKTTKKCRRSMKRLG